MEQHAIERLEVSTEKVSILSNPKNIGVLIVCLTALFIGIIKPFNGLPPVGHHMVGVVIVTLGLWIFKPNNVPFMAGCALLVAGGLVFGLNLNTVAAGFISSSVWILIPALYFGFVLQKTGLGKRIAYMVLKLFEPGWVNMAISWFIIGIALSALTPSITVRLAIVMPIAMGVIDACKLKYNSKGSAFIALIAFAMCLLPGTGWLTGSLSGPIMVGFLPAELKHLATFDSWFKILALPWFIVTVVYVALVVVLMKPKEAIGIPRDTFKEEYRALGPVSRQEIITGIILIACLVLFSTEKIHGIPAPGAALLALTLLLLFGIIKPAEIGTGANWDVIVFFGVTISLSSIFLEADVSQWIAPLLEPTILSYASNPLVFLLVFTAGIMLIRFIDVPWGFSTIALTAIVLIPVFNQFEIHPLVVTFAYLAGINFFLLNYQQPWLLMAEGIMQNKGWAANHVFTAGACYIIAAFVAILVCVPYWRMIGVIH
ncbi:MAG: SLC13 family permease [Pelotomaculaceae bacterium]|jgi:anion transporter|uniref:Di- and tricarboxylate transporters n=1 Tax=anaerobic digester metagenome TaxID=1263854 RepID=A0A485LYN4_9ZZZZ|nr:anion permease [Bacillota bacterium]HHU86290.1 tricarboxylate transporter [Peptococcaceae bacterium]